MRRSRRRAQETPAPLAPPVMLPGVPDILCLTDDGVTRMDWAEIQAVMAAREKAAKAEARRLARAARARK